MNKTQTSEKITRGGEKCVLVRDTVKSSIVGQNARLVKAPRVFVGFVGGPEQGLRRGFADFTNRGLNYVCYGG